MKYCMLPLHASCPFVELNFCDSCNYYQEYEEDMISEERKKELQKELQEVVKVCNPVIKDSGARSEFESGAVRDVQTGKGRMDLLPWRALMEISKHFEAGALKYSARNWEKGMPLSRYADSGPRHFGQFMIGRTDEPHLLAACWNFLCLLDTKLRIEDGTLPKELDDLPIANENRK